MTAMNRRFLFVSAHECVPVESKSDVLARTAQGLREIQAYEAHSPLIVLDRRDIFGARTFVIDVEGMSRLADDLARALPLP